MQIPKIVSTHPYLAAAALTVTAAALYVARAKVAALAIPFFKGIGSYAASFGGMCALHPVVTLLGTAAVAYAAYKYLYPTPAPKPGL